MAVTSKTLALLQPAYKKIMGQSHKKKERRYHLSVFCHIVRVTRPVNRQMISIHGSEHSSKWNVFRGIFNENVSLFYTAWWQSSGDCGHAGMGWVRVYPSTVCLPYAVWNEFPGRGGIANELSDGTSSALWDWKPSQRAISSGSFGWWWCGKYS